MTRGPRESLNDGDRQRQLRRWWLVVAILRSSGGVSLERLAHECGVSKRTARRDLIALEGAGLPLVRVVGEDDTEYGAPWALLKGSPCPICARGIATGKEYREHRSGTGAG
jgi:hypothetical protein